MGAYPVGGPLTAVCLAGVLRSAAVRPRLSKKNAGFLERGWMVGGRSIGACFAVAFGVDEFAQVKGGPGKRSFAFREGLLHAI